MTPRCDLASCLLTFILAGLALLGAGGQRLASAHDRPSGPPHKTRSAVMAQQGMAATSQPLATATAIRVLQYDGQGFWLATKRLSKGRFKWWPTGTEAARMLRAHQAQLLLAAGNPEAEAPPAWRPVNA